MDHADAGDEIAAKFPDRFLIALCIEDAILDAGAGDQQGPVGILF